MPTDPKEASKWEAYGETLLRFPGPPATRIDLRQPLDERARRALVALGLDRPFAVLTAENPSGENPEDAPTERVAERREEANDRRTSRLETALREAGIRFAAVDGSAPDGSYRERCVAAMMPQRDAVALAKRLDQLALFWYDGRDFWLLPADVEMEPERLPRAEGSE